MADGLRALGLLTVCGRHHTPCGSTPPRAGRIATAGAAVALVRALCLAA